MSTQSGRSQAAESRLSPSFLTLVYLNAFITGAVVMGFEMLGSRYLNPLFGSGIYTWAALISTVLASLTAGYFFGGWMADRNPKPSGLGWLIVAGSAYLALIPLFAEDLLELLSSMLGGIQDQREFERWGSILGAMLLLFVPLALLGVYSPYAIRLTLRATARSGTVAGRIYGISTLGSIFGTLFTTFYLIPAMGSRNITFLLSAIGVAAGISFLLVRPSAATRALPATAGALLLSILALNPGTGIPAAHAEEPRMQAVPAQAAGKESADRFVAYLRKQGLDVSHGAVNAGAGPGGFRIENLQIVDRNKAVTRAASFEASAFDERDNGEASLTGIDIAGVETAHPDKSTAKIAKIAAASFIWRPSTTDIHVALGGFVVRDVAVTTATGEVVRIAAFDLANLRVEGWGGTLAGLSIRTVTVSGGAESGSLGSFDVDSVSVQMPERISVKGFVFRDFVANTQRGTIRVGTVALNAFESRNMLERNPADLRALEFAVKDLDAPLTGGNDPKFEQDMRSLGYSRLKLNAELNYGYEEEGKAYNLRKFEIDIAEAATVTFALKIAGMTPDEIREALKPSPPQPGQPERRNQEGAAMSIAARLNLVSADLAFKDKSLLGRLIKREAERAQSTEAAIKAQYRAQLTALRDQQTDPLARDAIDAVMAFLENPGELVVTVRPPAPLNLVAVAGLAASNPEQFRSMLGITIVAKRP